MIKASGPGLLFGVGDTGCTTFTDIVVVVAGGLSSGETRPFEEAERPKATVTAPVFVPTGNRVGSAVTSRVMPSGGTTPDDGVTLSHGWFAVAVNGVPAA